MIGVGIHVIDPNRVRAQFLHEGSITLALLGVNERIIRPELIGNACSQSLAFSP
jgi:hypothetical protein